MRRPRIRFGSIMDMHPNHLRFATEYVSYGLKDLFAALDTLDPEFRDHVMGVTYASVIGYVPATIGAEFGGETWRTYYNYGRFRAKCGDLCGDGGVEDYFLARAIVFDVLSQLFGFENPDRPTMTTAELRSQAEQTAREVDRQTDPALKDAARLVHKVFASALKRRTEGTDRPVEGNYRRFCESFLTALFAIVDGFGRVESR